VASFIADTYHRAAVHLALDVGSSQHVALRQQRRVVQKKGGIVQRKQPAAVAAQIHHGAPAAWALLHSVLDGDLHCALTLLQGEPCCIAVLLPGSRQTQQEAAMCVTKRLAGAPNVCSTQRGDGPLPLLAIDMPTARGIQRQQLQRRKRAVLSAGIGITHKNVPVTSCRYVRAEAGHQMYRAMGQMHRRHLYVAEGCAGSDCRVASGCNRVHDGALAQGAAAQQPRRQTRAPCSSLQLYS
jgi:hypothetical protein